jgi:hypothetical protein
MSQFAGPVIFYLLEILTTDPVRGPVIYYLFEILRVMASSRSGQFGTKFSNHSTAVEYDYTFLLLSS